MSRTPTNRSIYRLTRLSGDSNNAAIGKIFEGTANEVTQGSSASSDVFNSSLHQWGSRPCQLRQWSTHRQVRPGDSGLRTRPPTTLTSFPPKRITWLPWEVPSQKMTPRAHWIAAVLTMIAMMNRTLTMQPGLCRRAILRGRTFTLDLSNSDHGRNMDVGHGTTRSDYTTEQKWSGYRQVARIHWPAIRSTAGEQGQSTTYDESGPSSYSSDSLLTFHVVENSDDTTFQTGNYTDTTRNRSYCREEISASKTTTRQAIATITRRVM